MDRYKLEFYFIESISVLMISYWQDDGNLKTLILHMERRVDGLDNLSTFILSEIRDDVLEKLSIEHAMEYMSSKCPNIYEKFQVIIYGE